jgi:hypothetical protein
MVRRVSLEFLQSMSVPRLMKWDLTRELDGVSVAKLINYQSTPIGRGRSIEGLFPGLISQELPAREIPKEANIFINRFTAAGGDFPATGFRTPGWFHPSAQKWWREMVDFVLIQLKEVALESGLY